MAQFLRPDSTVTATSFTGGFADIDETTASDADFAFTPDASAGTLEVGLLNPTGTPGAGSTTIRYRLGKSNDGVLDQAGTGQPTCTVSLVQGTTILTSDTLRTVSGLTDYTWSSVDTSGVTDWNDVRLRFVAGSSGGNPTNRRGLAVIWAELEAPEPAADTNDELDIPGMTVGTPVLGTPAFTAVHILAIAAMNTGAVALANPAVSQVHALSIPEFATGQSVLGNPSLSENGSNHELVIDAMSTGTPILDAAGLVQTHVLSPQGLDAGTPVLSSPSLAQSHVLTLALGTQAPVLGSPALGQVHAISIAAMSAGTPSLGNPSLSGPGGPPTHVYGRRCRRLKLSARFGLTRR